MLAVCCLLFLSACTPPEKVAAAPKPASEYFPISVGGVTINLQLAVTDAEMERGLMFRRDVGLTQGMLFVYPGPRKVSFWMRNTPTPLEIGYFSGDGILREVYSLVPHDERSVSSRREDIQYALEVRAGWFETTGVKPGARLDLRAVASAMTARGFSLKPYRGLR